VQNTKVNQENVTTKDQEVQVVSGSDTEVTKAKKLDIFSIP
jgi:hypothetical protein